MSINIYDILYIFAQGVEVHFIQTLNVKYVFNFKKMKIAIKSVEHGEFLWKMS